MTSYLGQASIFLTIIINIFILYFYKLITINNKKIENLIILFVRLQFFLILFSFFCLIAAYIVSDFNNINVYYNSHTDKPIIYKISGVWGNHEGSILLWVLIMSAYTFVFSFEKMLDSKTKNLTILFQIIMTTFFIIFMVLTSNPLITTSNNYIQGLGLNPILQDPALAIHPPLLYMGYVGFSLVLSLALAGLLSNSISKNWAKVASKYSLFCWAMLTVGIATGSFWAYYELGWGGWWFWDPVENASLMPWLAGLALIHSLKVLEKNNELKRWIIFLSILCFSLSLLGTFLVRSGVLMSVHAFANDISRGIFILMLFLTITGFSFLIFLTKTPKNNNSNKFFVFNKTGTIIINNITMCVVCFTVLLGTLYPLIIESLMDNRISVGAPYFNSTVFPILIPGILLMAVAPALNWEKNKYSEISRYIFLFFVILLFCITVYIFSNDNPWGIIGLGISSWIILTSLIGIHKNIISLKKINLNKIILTNSAYIAHFGVAILIIGITASSIWKKEYSENMLIGEILNIDGYSLKFQEIYETEEKNYRALKAKFILNKNNKNIAEIVPEKRYFPVSKIITTEAGIKHYLLQDIYIVLGEEINKSWSIKVYQNPLVSLIWIGVSIILFGSVISIRNK